jgi:hypothetical protein
MPSSAGVLGVVGLGLTLECDFEGFERERDNFDFPGNGVLPLAIVDDGG